MFWGITHPERLTTRYYYAVDQIVQDYLVYIPCLFNDYKGEDIHCLQLIDITPLQ